MELEENLYNAISLLESAGITTDKTGSSIDLMKYSREITKLKEVINYLKDSTKIKVESQLISDNNTLKDELKASKEILEASIVSKTDELKNLPKITLVRPKLGLIGNFKAIEKELCQKKNETLKAQRRAKVNAIKAEISDAKLKLKQISELERNLNTAKRTERFFMQKEKELVLKKRASLIDYCYKALNTATYGVDFFDKNDVFLKKEDGTIEINNKSAKSFISAAKNEKSILKLNDFLEAKQKVVKARIAHGKDLYNLKLWRSFKERVDLEVIGQIIDRTNEFIRDFEELKKLEESARKGTKLNRIVNFFRRSIRLPDKIKIPDEVIEKRKDLSNKINFFVNEVEKNKELSDAYKDFLILKNGLNKKNGVYDNVFSLNYLKSISAQITAHGDLARFTTKTTSLEDLKENIINSMNQIEEKEKQSLAELEDAKKQKDDLATKLSKRDMQILQRIGEKGVNYIAKTFYADELNVVGNRYKENKMSASVAMLVLEGLVNVNKADYIKVMDVYGKLYDEVTKNDEQNSIKTEVLNIMSSIKDKAKELAGTKQNEEVVIFTPSNVDNKKEDNTVEI